MEAAVQEQLRNRPAQFVDPSLILRVRMEGMLLEEDWANLGLTLLSSDDDRNIVLFSSAGDLAALIARLDAYDGPIPIGQAGRRYEGFVSRIESVGTLAPRDRLGIRFREAGFTEATDLQDGQIYTVDIELWDFGGRAARERKANEIETFIDNLAGEVHDRYIGPSITLLRASASGQALRPLLSMPEVASIDLPPLPDLEAYDLVRMELPDAPAIVPADADAPVIGVLDSGLNEHPFLAGSIAGLTAFPAALGMADVWGHGTRVAGVAAFGDLRGSRRANHSGLPRGSFPPRLFRTMVASTSGGHSRARCVRLSLSCAQISAAGSSSCHSVTSVHAMSPVGSDLGRPRLMNSPASSIF